MPTSKDTPLIFFDNLIETNGYNNLKQKTINQIKEQVNGYFESVDFDLGEIRFWDHEYDIEAGESKTELTTYNFRKEFPRKITSETIKTKSLIDNSALDINKKGNNNEAFLKSQIKHIYFLLDKLGDSNIVDKLLIKESLEGLCNHIVDRYSIKHTYKNRNVQGNNISSYFDLKGHIKMSLIVELFDAAIDLEVIDDEVISEDTFINVLTGHPSYSNEVISFKCNNQLAVHFIDSLKPIFNNLSYSQISKSKQFFNCKLKVFQQADLDNAKSRLKNNRSEKINQITSVINHLITGQ